MLFWGGTSFLPLLQFCPQEDNLFSFSFLSLSFPVPFFSLLSLPCPFLSFNYFLQLFFFFFNCWDSVILLAVETVGQGDFGSWWFSIFTHWCICPKREEALLDNMFKWNKLTTPLGSKTRSVSLWTKHRTEMQNARLQPRPCWDLGLEVVYRQVESRNMITEIRYSTQSGHDIARLTWDVAWGWVPFCLEKILWLSAARVLAYKMVSTRDMDIVPRSQIDLNYPEAWE